MKINPYILASLIVAAMVIGWGLSSVDRLSTPVAQTKEPSAPTVGRYQFYPPHEMQPGYAFDTSTGQMFSYNGAVNGPAAWARLGSPADAPK
ncbi:MAG: hypothetical protein ABSH08_13255 [Tepidisphaeraceae bacterium]|jgi:hypothetical protein